MLVTTKDLINKFGCSQPAANGLLTLLRQNNLAVRQDETRREGDSVGRGAFVYEIPDSITIDFVTGQITKPASSVDFEVVKTETQLPVDDGQNYQPINENSDVFSLTSADSSVE